MSNTYHNASEGEQRKRDALALLQAHRDRFIRQGRRALLARLLDDGKATIDAVRAAVQLPADISPKLFGAVPTALAEAGLIRAAGYAKTTRPEAHARPVQVWTLADRAGALAWLECNPDLPDDGASEPKQRNLFNIDW